MVFLFILENSLASSSSSSSSFPSPHTYFFFYYDSLIQLWMRFLRGASWVVFFVVQNKKKILLLCPCVHVCVLVISLCVCMCVFYYALLLIYLSKNKLQNSSFYFLILFQTSSLFIWTERKPNWRLKHVKRERMRW